MATHSRGAPYPVSTDANDTPAWLNSLASWVNERPGITPATTTQRNAMSGVERWDGRVVLDTTLDRLFYWDAGLAVWTQIANFAEIAALLATTGTPASEAATASRGVATTAARSDHVHPFPTTETLFAGSLNLATGMVNTGDATTAYRKGGMVTLEIYIQCNTAGNVLLTMPVGWRPPGIIRGGLNLSANNITRAINVAADGSVNVEGGLTATQNVYGSIVFPTA